MPSKACQACDGHGRWLLLNSWFTADGYRAERCHVCGGSGINPLGYADWGGGLAFQRKARARVAEWGGMKPPSDAANPPTRTTASPEASDA